MSEGETRTKVAIACQGGGSHTAFTAGALQHLIEHQPPDHEYIAFSGTSGGAICALMAWYGLHTGGTRRAVELLESVWASIAARSTGDRLLNSLAVSGSRFISWGGWLPQYSPYDPPFAAQSRRAQAELRRTLTDHVDFQRIDRQMTAENPRLIVGTVDINTGTFEAFEDEVITADTVLASAAIPTLFQAVTISGHAYWDGLFSQNPPIREFLENPDDVTEKPDEIWVIQINPQTQTDEPTSLEAIADRRNELSGNLSLNQELNFIEQVNKWVKKDMLSDEYKPVTTDRIMLQRKLDTASKLNRDSQFIDQLMQAGRKEAEQFLNQR